MAEENELESKQVNEFDISHPFVMVDLSKNFIIQFFCKKNGKRSLITHNLELVWRKHGGHCVIYFMLVENIFFLNPVALFCIRYVCLVGWLMFFFSLPVRIYLYTSIHGNTNAILTSALFSTVLWCGFFYLVTEETICASD